MDFKIGDDFDENGNVKEHKVNKKIAIAMVAIIAIVIGLVVFFVSNAIFGDSGDDETPVDTQVELSDENVQILYKYVAYKDNGYGNDKFLKETATHNNEFTDEEKMYYILQFLQPSDLQFEGNVNDKKQKVYVLSISKLKSYLPRFFGNDPGFTPPAKMTYKFGFKINDLSVAEFTFSEDEQIYNVVFNKEESKKEELVKPFYTKLTSALKKADGTLILTEKVIYATSEKADDTYNVKIFKDYGHTTTIMENRGLTEEQVKTNPISIDNYLEKAATVTYTFGVNKINRNYYFDSSTITY